MIYDVYTHTHTHRIYTYVYFVNIIINIIIEKKFISINRNDFACYIFKTILILETAHDA